MALVKNNAPEDLAMVKNPMAYEFTADAINKRVRLKLFIEKVRESGNYEMIAEQDQAVDSEAKTTFRIEELLKPYLSYELPTIGQSTAKITAGIIKRYLARYAQRDPAEHILVDELYQDSGSDKLLYLSSKLDGTNYRIVAFTDDDTGLEVVLSDGTTNTTINIWGKVHNYHQSGWSNLADFDRITIPSGIRFEIYAEPVAFTEDSSFQYVALAGWNRNAFPGRIPGNIPGGEWHLSIKYKRRITRDQPEWIYAVPLINYTDYNVEFTLYFTDDTSQSFIVNYGAAVAKQSIIIPIGYDIHDYDNINAAKTIKYIRISGQYTFYIELYPREVQGPFKREFYFMNSLGGIDSFVAVGKGQESMRYEREQIRKYQEKDYAIEDAQYLDHNVRMRKELTVATGWLQKNSKWDEVQVLRDMLNSEAVYVKDGTDLVPIQILNKEDLMQIDGEYLRGGQIRYMYAFEEIANTPS